MRHHASAFLPHLLLLVAACAAQTLLTLEECEEKRPAFKTVTISPCHKDPCVLKIGEKYNVSFSFEATSDADFMRLTTAAVQQQTNTRSIRFVRSAGCRSADLPCNVTKGEVAQGSGKLSLSGAYVPGNMTYKLHVRGGEETFACGVAHLTVE